MKTRAVEKHSTFNNEIKNVPSAYKLLYPDKRLADKLPATDDGFQLKAYKEALGKPYSRITFFLTTHTDYFDYIFSSDVLSSSDESVTELTTTWSYSCPTTCTTSTSSTSTFTSDTSTFITNKTACATTAGTPFYTHQQPSTSGINEKQPSTSSIEQQPSTSGTVHMPHMLPAILF